MKVPTAFKSPRRSASLQLKELRKHFGSVAAMDGISLDVAAGEFLTLLGASGSGKTSTLMAVAGFLYPDSGKVLVNDVEQNAIPAQRRDMGMVFQHYALFPHMTVEKNIAFPLEMRGMSRSVIAERVRAVLELVRLVGFELRKPDELSGGQQQRVALARALVYEPSILLLDEPLGALDKNLREEMQREIRRIQRQLGITTIAVTHDQQEAIAMSDRIGIMRAGRMEQVGSPRDIYERPRNRFVAAFMGASNFIAGHVVEATTLLSIRLKDGAVISLENHADLPQVGPVDIVVRPERLSIGRDTTGGGAGHSEVMSQISAIEYAGDCWKISLDLASGETMVASRANRGSIDFAPGDRVLAGWAIADVWAVPASG
jgi:putative spermidine/putrescine transport system ATP-binding protein